MRNASTREPIRASLSSVIALVFTLGLFVSLPVQFSGSGNTFFLSSAHAGLFGNNLKRFDDVLDLVANRYVYPPDYKKIFSSAIEGMIKATKDDHLKPHPLGEGFGLKKGEDYIKYRLNFSRRENMKTLNRVYDFLAKNYPLNVGKEKLETAAIHHLMDSLDPYSLYMNPKVFADSMRDTDGEYGGLGMIITMEDYKLTIVKTIDNSPAKRAGILPKDIITEVSGEPVKGMQIQELASKLRGPPGTSVSLNISRPKTDERFSHRLTREVILIESVTYKPLADQIGYIKISSFSKKTNDQLEIFLKESIKRGTQAYILDLRNNPGGLLSQSVLVSSQFLNRDDLVVYTKSRLQRESQEYVALLGENLLDVPLMILINHQSASASEIVAGSLKDSGRALILGENSYGKGSVQTIFQLRDGAGLRLTTAKYFTPAGGDITLNGITPDILIHKDDIPTKDRSSKLSFQEKNLAQFLKEKNISWDEDKDIQIQFAAWLLKNNSDATKNRVLAKARKLNLNTHY